MLDIVILSVVLMLEMWRARIASTLFHEPQAAVGRSTSTTCTICCGGSHQVTVNRTGCVSSRKSMPMQYLGNMLRYCVVEEHSE